MRNSVVVGITEAGAGAQAYDGDIMATFGGAGHGPVGRCGWARAGVGIEMPVGGAKVGAAQATTHGVNDRFVLPICTFRVVAVPG